MAEKKEKQYVSDNAQLMAEWDWEKNSTLEFDPTQITTGSGKKVWWICFNGHEWQAKIAHRSKGAGCPICAKKNTGIQFSKNWIEEKGALADNNPELSKEWHPYKNQLLTPKDVACKSNKKVWWICSEGHEWQASINHRSNGRNCPYCAGKKVLTGYNDLQTVNPILAKEWNYEKNTGVTPMDVSPSSDKKMWWKCRNGHDWQATIGSRNGGAGCPYCAGQKVIQGYNDLQTVQPNLAKEWNYEKNDGLTPRDVFPHSIKKVWWKCEREHEWQTSISNRNKGHGCPYCAGQKAIQGYNDLQTVNPTLAKEWNYEKNNGLTPMDIMSNSGKKVWWRCIKGHEWQAIIASRNNGIGCPICSSERKTSFPEYALIYYLEKYGLETVHLYRELGYELDIYIPSQKIAIEYDGYFFHKNSRAKDLEKNYKCAKDGIKLYRIRECLPPLNNSSIDYVAQKDLQKTLEEFLSVIIGDGIDINLERDTIAIENLREYTEKEDSLLFSVPKLAKEWNYEKNGNLRPENVTVNSGKKVWWVCSLGHEWQTTISHRNNGTGCPYCSGKKAWSGFNDLQTVNPTLAKEWNYGKNNGLMPSNVMPNSGQKVWWICSNGHEWQATIKNRNNGRNCPYCSGRYAIKGENDLQTVNPTLAKEWNYKKNNGVTPSDVLPNSNKKVWWICSQGHEWQTTIAHRNNGHGCPYCSGRKNQIF